MSILDDDTIALEFYNALAPIYMDGQLVRVTYTDDGTGSVAPSTNSQPIKVQRDEISEAQRIAAGYGDRDATLLILRYGVGEMDANCKVEFDASEYAVVSCRSDPAGAYWQVRATKLS